MQARAKIVLSGIVLFSAAACSSDPQADSESWYDQSRRHSEARQDYVDTYMDQGVSELEAKRSWEAREMIRKTERSWHSVTVRGDELFDVVDPE